MEPNLKDIDDYTKPLSDKKLKTITIVFLSVIAIYATFSYIIKALG